VLKVRGVVTDNFDLTVSASELVFLFVQVFCRVRPLDNDHDSPCIKVLSVSAVQLTQPEVCKLCYPLKTIRRQTCA